MLQDSLNLFQKFQYFFDIRGLDPIGFDDSPDGWEKTIIEFNRSKELGGVFRNLTLPYKWVNKAAFLCRQEYAKYGQMSKIIQRVNLGDGRNNYSEIYRGRLDFSTKQDTETGFTVSSKTADFSANIDAYKDQKYSLSLDDGKYIEITPIILNETATLIIGRAPDGNVHSDYFPPITIVNNKVNSINPSVFNVNYEQFRNPDFSQSGTQVYRATVANNVLITGTLNLSVVNLGVNPTRHLGLAFFDSGGTNLLTVYDENVIGGTIKQVPVTVNASLPLGKGQELYLYMKNFDGEVSGAGITVLSGQLDFSYQTITPPTMCKALSLDQIFAKLLQAMNVNDNSQANLPVVYQSFLLKEQILKDIVVTSSDSIRASQGSIYHSGDTLFQGIYIVVSGSINYGGTTYIAGKQFSYTPSFPTFTGSGVVQKISAIYSGVTYQPGEDLQPGGTYLVDGSSVTYNNTLYQIGDTFKYVLNQDTFTATTPSGFVKQIGAEPQLITSFGDLFQTIKGLMGGNAAFGVDKQVGNPLGVPFIEKLDYVFRKGVGTVKLGVVDKDWKSIPAIDLLYNSIKVGYEDQQYDAINGQQEVNSTQFYGTDLLNPVAELDLICKYRADPIGIETVRVTQQDTAASRSDNDAFMIWINPTPVNTTPFLYYHPLLSEGATSITGVDPSYYNYYMSPKHNLLRGDAYLASIFYNMVGYQIKPTSILKNRGLVVTDLSGKKVTEGAPINIADLPKPYFIPEYYDVNMGSTLDIINMIDGNPYADLSFVVNGKTARAFISNVKLDISKESVQDLKLLLTGDNNLSDFVR